jgi:hypothetical protein
MRVTERGELPARLHLGASPGRGWRNDRRHRLKQGMALSAAVVALRRGHGPERAGMRIAMSMATTMATSVGRFKA